MSTPAEHPCAVECQRREHKGYRRCHDEGECDYATGSKLQATMAALYASEINCGVQSFWDGGWEAWLGDAMNGRKAEDFGLVTFDEIADWLRETAIQQYPASAFASKYASQSRLTGERR